VGRAVTACIAAGLAALGVCAAAAPASASFHLMRISEIHADGDGLGPDNDYVELQMYAPGQNFVQTHYLRTYDNSGAPLATYQFPNSVPNGESQRTILIASGPTVVGGVSPDFNAGSDLNLTKNTSGALCYIDQLPATGLDCVAYGFSGYTIQGGAPSPFGTPALGINGLMDGQTLQRTEARGCRLQLDPADDTNDSAADFSLGAPSPRNNSTKPSEIPCVPCPTSAKLATIVGTPGADVLRGTGKADRIAGLGGRDRIKGLGGNDVLCGGAGNDRLLGGKGRDRLLGQGGRDVLLGQGGRDILLGGPGPDLLRGGPAKDVLRGGPGRDRQVQ
jgi:Ca2+-binding RTX toxin-like protein